MAAGAELDAVGDLMHAGEPSVVREPQMAAAAGGTRGVPCARKLAVLGLEPRKHSRAIGAAGMVIDI